MIGLKMKHFITINLYIIRILSMIHLKTKSFIKIELKVMGDYSIHLRFVEINMI
jgi:hypothetical protein